MADDTNLFGEALPRLGAPLFAERWSNRKAFWIGVYAGQGLSAPAICERLADGIQPNTVTGMLSHWGFRLPDAPKTHGLVPVLLSARDRTLIDAEAMRVGLDMSELCSRILSTVAREGLWKAILDD